VIRACKTLHRSEIEAVVYDKAVLGHTIKEYAWREIELLPHTLLRYNYAIALPHGSLLREPTGPYCESLINQYGEKRSNAFLSGSLRGRR
jgi:hypothetical protein